MSDEYMLQAGLFIVVYGVLIRPFINRYRLKNYEKARQKEE